MPFLNQVGLAAGVAENTLTEIEAHRSNEERTEDQRHD
jgi:hypothetical protein